MFTQTFDTQKNAYVLMQSEKSRIWFQVLNRIQVHKVISVGEWNEPNVSSGYVCGWYFRWFLLLALCFSVFPKISTRNTHNVYNPLLYTHSKSRSVPFLTRLRVLPIGGELLCFLSSSGLTSTQPHVAPLPLWCYFSLENKGPSCKGPSTC